MKNLINYTGNEILCFHIGRGGKFFNQGHLTFSGTKKITNTSDFDRLFPPKYKNGNDNLRSKKAEWLSETGNPVELTNEMVKSGVGRINFDNDFDTTYTTYMKDLSEDEIEAVIKADTWDVKYIKTALIELKMIESEEEFEDEN